MYYLYVYIVIYIYRERERDYVHMYIYIYNTYIYIYIHIYIYIWFESPTRLQRFQTFAELARASMWPTIRMSACCDLSRVRWHVQGFKGYGLSTLRVGYLVPRVSFCVFVSCHCSSNLECCSVLSLVVWRFFESRDVYTVPSNSILNKHINSLN